MAGISTSTGLHRIADKDELIEYPKLFDQAGSDEEFMRDQDFSASRSGRLLDHPICLAGRKDKVLLARSIDVATELKHSRV